MSTALFTSPVPDIKIDLPVDALTRLQDEVHLWWLPPTGGEAFAHWDLLSADELDRARHFHFSYLADEWVANRARLRMVLGAYLPCEPKDISFEYDEAGKPSIAKPSQQLQFNLSHTEGMAVIAVTRARTIGVDVERATDMADVMDLARFAFSASEIAALETIDDPVSRNRAFLRIWTCKEAFLKGLGDGLSKPLQDFSIRIGVDGPSIVDCQWNQSALRAWKLIGLDAPAGFIASLAVTGHETHPMKLLSFRPGHLPL